MDKWDRAQEWELAWHGDAANLFHEEEKQIVYASRMGLEFTRNAKTPYVLDLQGKSVIDIGSGPCSLLLKAENFSRAYAVDPLMDKFPEWVRGRYRAHGITPIAACGETVDLPPVDEVWIYNVLEHVQNPEAVAKNALRLGKVVRLFEWVNMCVNEGHIHALTREQLEEWFGPGAVEEMAESGCYGSAFYGVFGKAKTRKRGWGMKVHLLGLAHTVTSREQTCCAYTQKVLKMAHMLTDLGYEVIHYGAEGSEVPCEHVTTITRQDQIDAYGDYDWRRHFFRFDFNDHAYKIFTDNTVREINKRKGPRDILLVSFGTIQKPVADKVGIPLTVEMGIGYEGVFAPFRVFESYTWMHNIYGKRREEPKFYDVVIPNYFDLNDFHYREDKDDYLAFLGRLIANKGVQIAIDVARITGRKLLVAGQGTLDNFNTEGAEVEHIGTIGAEERDEFLGKAHAVLVPTTYIEPFGGVAVEAQLCGTPVITTDWGAFPETVLHGITGYRCRTMDDFVWAARNVDKIDKRTCREWAAKNYSMERISKMYDEYFFKLQDLFRSGWYQLNDDREELDWLRKAMP